MDKAGYIASLIAPVKQALEVKLNELLDKCDALEDGYSAKLTDFEREKACYIAEMKTERGRLKAREDEINSEVLKYNDLQEQLRRSISDAAAKNAELETLRSSIRSKSETIDKKLALSTKTQEEIEQRNKQLEVQYRDIESRWGEIKADRAKVVDTERAINAKLKDIENRERVLKDRELELNERELRVLEAERTARYLIKKAELNAD